MTTHPETAPGTPGQQRALRALVAALGFVLAYLSTEVALSVAASSALPLPTSSATVAREWYAANQLAAVLVGVCQAVSVLFLAWFAGLVGSVRSRAWGLLAVGLMLASSACTWLLATVAPTGSLGTVDLLRDAGFITGGTAHVVALGVFVLLTTRDGSFGRPVRVLAVVAAVACVLSLSSLVVFEGAALILLGRLLCMVWALSAATSLLLRRRRRRRRTTPVAATVADADNRGGAL